MKKFNCVFYVGVLIYMILRFVVAIPTLGPYGVNPFIFGLLDVITAIPYAIGVPKIIAFAKQKNSRKIMQWIMVLAISFVIPYGYIAASGEKIPILVWGALVIIIMGFGLESFLTVRSKIRKALQEDEQTITQSYKEAIISKEKNISM